jgi:hypothetical protein
MEIDNMLPNSWKPNNAVDLVRVGPNADGGYVIPSAVLDKTDILFGLGVNDDWDFEVDFQKRSGCQVVCYDHSVNARFWRRRFKKDLSAFLLLRKFQPKKFKAMFKYFDYKRYFDGNKAIHHQIKIGYDMPGSISINGIVKKYDKGNIFFKIDIEGSEYRVIDQLQVHADRIVGFVIEFHDVDIHRQRISDFIAGLKDFTLMHIHANNHQEKRDENNDPITVEMSFLRNDLVKSNEIQDVSYPIKGLDFPNSPRDKDFTLAFEPA